MSKVEVEVGSSSMDARLLTGPPKERRGAIDGPRAALAATEGPVRRLLSSQTHSKARPQPAETSELPAFGLYHVWLVLAASLDDVGAAWLESHASRSPFLPRPRPRTRPRQAARPSDNGSRAAAAVAAASPSRI
jgi:hypothetical protein